MDYEALSQSAERRLLDHRRRELGAGPAVTTAWTPAREAPPAAAPTATLDRAGARIDVGIAAWPADGLIPGAVVTVTATLINGGIEGAQGLCVVAPAPSGTAYRPGTLKHDGRDADGVAEALFGEGYRIGTLAAGGRTALTWKLDVGPGATDLILAPTITADVPVVAARPLVLRRGTMAGAFRTDLSAAATRFESVPTTHEDLEAPIYELTPDEEIEETALLTAIDRGTPRATTGARPLEPAAPALFRTIRPGDLAFVERLLEAPLGLLPHFVFANFLATATTGDGSDPLGLATFVDREAALLGRLKVAARLGKPLQLEEPSATPPALDIEHATIRFSDPPARRIAGAALLQGALDPQRLADARAAYDRPVARWLSLRLVTLAFCAQGLADPSNAHAASVKTALSTYSMQARLAFVAFATRMKLDRRLDPTRTATTQLDAAARSLIEALRAAIAANG